MTNKKHQEKESILTQVRQAIIDSIDEQSFIAPDRFFKEGEAPKVYGLNMVVVSKIAKSAFEQIKAVPKHIIFELCEELWKSGYLEEAIIACKWSESLHKQFEPADFAVFERWLSKYVTNWADCDTFCNHTVGFFLMKYPDHIAKLKAWTKSPNRWVRRGSAVSLIIPARKGMFLDDILEIADILLLDKDDLVQKGYGWMLKAASMSETFLKADDYTKQKHLDAVFNFVIKNRSVMPRTALRYAIEKMPVDLKAEAMKK
ncbi:MAG: DNA alkylation repair protein [Prevotellaceae bacterium]|jgi:3-methyladenine DNA glycosylase AlkD|nr:DNA alkylation repair protein [Prevotellaceae bacterium]